MAVYHGITVTPSTSPAVGNAKLGIAVVGTSSTGTVPNNTLRLVTSATDALAFGAGAAGDTIPSALQILLRYGCANIIVIQVAKGADAPTTALNIIGGVDGVSGLKTGLNLLQDAYSQLNVRPRVILAPGFNAANVITQFLAIATRIGAIALADFSIGETVATVTTARATITGLGTKDSRLVVCFPNVRNASTGVLEPLGTHLAGVMANNEFMRNYGFSPSSQPLRGVSSLELPLNMSFSDDTSDTEALARLGVVTVNRQDAGLIIWGNRNSSYAPPSSDLMTYIPSIRVRDHLTTLLTGRASLFLDQPSNRNTAMMLQESFNRMLGDQQALGAIAPNAFATFQESLSDYTTGKLVYTALASPFLPIEQINISSQLTIQVVAQVS